MPRVVFGSLILLPAVAAGAHTAAETFNPLVLENIAWRHIGPSGSVCRGCLGCHLRREV
jgi:hypothetical protein